MSHLAPYTAAFASRFREELQYRAAAFAGLVTQTVFGFLIVMVLLEFYASSDRPPPLDRSATLAYVWLGQATFALLPWNLDPSVARSVQTGDVVLELLRPVDTFRLWLARALAWRCVRAGLRGVPMVLLAGLLFPRIGIAPFALPAPSSPGAAGLFLIGLVLGVTFSAALTVAMQVGLFWTVRADGILRLIATVSLVLSGNILPLPLYPDWAQSFLALQPFRGLIDTPLRLYSGHLAGPEAWSALGLSLFWLLVTLAVGASAMRRGLGRLAVAGG